MMHLHTEYGIAVSAQEDGLLPISQQSLFVLSLGYHDYEGLALNERREAAPRCRPRQEDFLILRTHGLLTVGPTVADAFLAMFLLERACRIQILAQSGGGKLVPIDERIFAQIPAQEAVVTQGGGGRLVWPGLLRKLDRMNADFRD